MRKQFILALTALMLVGCGNSQQTNSSNATAPVESPLPLDDEMGVEMLDEEVLEEEEEEIGEGFIEYEVEIGRAHV